MPKKGEWLQNGSMVATVVFSQKKTRQLAGGFRLCSTAIFDCAVPLYRMATTDITVYA